MSLCVLHWIILGQRSKASVCKDSSLEGIKDTESLKALQDIGFTHSVFPAVPNVKTDIKDAHVLRVKTNLGLYITLPRTSNMRRWLYGSQISFPCFVIRG